MKVTIGLSSGEEMENIYREESQKVINYLIQKGYSICWGVTSKLIRGIDQEQLMINGYTTNKYYNELDKTIKGKFELCDNTFNVKNKLFAESDLVLFLPGGIGTISELFSFIEECRSNDIKKKIVIYNIENHFDSTINLIKDLVARKFIFEDIFNYFIIVDNFNDFCKVIN